MESIFFGVNQTYFRKIQHFHKILNQSRPLIKICGNKFTSEAFKVASFKPDFMGWIFSPFSPRRISLDKAEHIIKNIQNAHPEILHVGVFAGNSIYEILDIVKTFNQKTRGLDLLQITEGSGFILRLRTILQQEHIFIPVIPVIRPNSPITEDLFFPTEPSLFWIVDKFDPNKKGGTGKTIPKEFFVKRIEKPFLIAGGITPENAIDYLKLSNAKGVDISSGLEDAPGIKNEKKIQQLLEKIYNFSYS